MIFKMFCVPVELSMCILKWFLVPLKVVILSFFRFLISLFQLVTNFALLEKIVSIFLNVFLLV